MRFSRLDDCTNYLNNRKQQKLEAEKTAFSNCKEDLSDVLFEVGGHDASGKATLCILGFVLLFAARFIVKYTFDDLSEMAGALNFVFIVIIVCLAIFGVWFFVTDRKPPILVNGKSVKQGDKIWTNKDISHVECTSLNKIKVHSRGKVIFSFSWEVEDSELFLAWARKCGIVILDKRIRLS